MFNIGAPEMVVIFLLALILFGPKKLPELGRTVAKAITEFRRASSDLKASFEREMHNLERETDALKESEKAPAKELPSAPEYEYNPYHEYGEGDSPYVADHNPTHDSTHPSITVSASEVPGAESKGIAEAVPTDAVKAEEPQAVTPAVEGTVPRETPQHTN
jgi:TatA/E family protein of Tat protein translocase